MSNSHRMSIPGPIIHESACLENRFGLRTSQLQFWSDTLRGKSFAYLLFLVAMMGISAALMIIFKSDPHSSLLPLQVVYYLTVAGMLFHRVLRGSWTNFMAPDVAFVAFFTLVHFGYVTPYTLGLIPYSNEVFHFDHAIPGSLLVVNIGLVAFLVGYELAGPSTAKRAGALPPEIIQAKWCTLGFFLLGTGIAMHVSGIFSAGIGDFIEYGNTIIQNDRVKTRAFHTKILLAWGNRLYLIGLTTYMLASALRVGKLFESAPAKYLFFMMFFLYILEGERGPIFISVLPALFIRHYIIRPWKPYTLIVIVLAFGMLFVGIFTMRKAGADPTEMINELQFQAEKGEVKTSNIYLEIGFIYNTLNHTVGVVPEHEPYWYGAGWRDAVIHIVPFAQGIAMRYGFGKPAPSKWLITSMFGSTRGGRIAGRGFTITGDGYLNFGYPGVFIELFAIGYFFRWVFVRFCIRPSMARGLFMFATLGIIIMISRNHANLLIPQIVHLFFITWLLGKFMGESHQVQT